MLLGVLYSTILSRHASQNALEAAREAKSAAVVAKAGNTQLLSNSREAQRQRHRLIVLQTTINNCLDPKKLCAKRGFKQSQNLLAATVVCQKLDSVRTKDEALDCVRRVVLQP
jgi:hypothetical protein